PRDRIGSVPELFARLGRDASLGARETGRSVGRAVELAALSELGPGVHYVVGPSGVGKSHVLREFLAFSLLAGRDARLHRFPCEHEADLRRVLALLREDNLGTLDTARKPLVVLDDLHSAPEDVRTALEIHRCRAAAGARVTVIAGVRRA